MIKKAELRDRLAITRKAFDKQIKEKETVANKEVCFVDWLLYVHSDFLALGNRENSATFQG